MRTSMLMTATLLLMFTTTHSAVAQGFLSKFGSQGSLDGQFEGPTGIAVAGDGSIWVADAGNNRVQKFDSSGAFVLQVPAGAPSGVAVDSHGNLYVSEPEDRMVRKFDSSGHFLLQIEPVCSVGIGNCVDPDGPGPRPTVYSPTGVAVDLLDHVYVIGTFHLQKFDVTGTLLVEFPLGGIVPRAITVDSAGNIIIFEKDNGTINKYDAAGIVLRRFGGAGPADGQFGADPGGLATDAAGNIYATDPANARVQKFDGSGNFQLKFARWGRVTDSSAVPCSILRPPRDPPASRSTPRVTSTSATPATTASRSSARWSPRRLRPTSA
jgi:DNA-binding beta-propeller fold protein YncE